MRLAGRLLRGVVVAVGAALAVGLLGFVGRSYADPVQRFDKWAVLHATDVTRAHDGLFTALVAWQQALQPLWVYLTASIICAIVAARWPALRVRALWAWVTMMVGWNLALDIKLIVQRARPVIEDPIEIAPGYSFPSGHAANTTIAVTALVVLLWPLLQRTGRVAAVAAGSLIVVLTALDRVFLGVHFPSDVTAGTLLGVALILGSYAGFTGRRSLPPTES